MNRNWVVDRRDSKRAQVIKAVQIEFQDPKNDEIHTMNGKILSISETGVAFSTDKCLPGVSNIVVRLPSPRKISVSVNIIWRDDNNGLYRGVFLPVNREIESDICDFILESSGGIQAFDRRNVNDRRSLVYRSNRHINKRFQFKELAGVKIITSGKSFILNANLLNIGKSGTCICLDRNLHVGELLTIRVINRGGIIELQGIVRWSVKVEKNRFVAGVQFNDKNPATKFLEELISQGYQLVSDRRHSNVDRRKLSELKRNALRGEFVLEKTVYLTDTNAFGNTYFSRYFDWQGMAREAFVRVVIPNYEQFFMSGIRLITVEASMSYLHETKVFDDVLISLRLGELKKASAELIFDFRLKRTKQLLGIGRQRIAFINHEGKIVPMPKYVCEGLRPFLGNHQKSTHGSFIPASQN
ncbi:MAG: PilZ domain-containing protein [Elusimicrobia bacterium]|nr:PilZ domain-containing protein [Candidatus Obscuribacterium magneticum]